LGLYIDENLNWKEHCKKVIGKINKGGYLLWRHKRKLSSGTKKLIYKSFVRCHLLYGLIVWGPVGVKHENLKKPYKGYTTNLARDMSTQIDNFLKITY
jgi:hypothetical protein